MRNHSRGKGNHQKTKPSFSNSSTKSEGDGQEGLLSKYIKDERMITILNKKGISKLFPIQYSTFNYIYEGKDLVAKDRTGSGKTMAFSLPVICQMREKGLFKKPHKTKFLIVLPTRELAIQVRDEISSLRLQDEDDFTVGAVYGGSSVKDQAMNVEKGLDIIVGTPGRLIDFLNRGIIKLDKLEVTCLDEADEMLKQGFKEDIEQIFNYAHANKRKTQNLLFSATIPDWIWSISELYQTKDRPFIDLIKDKNIRTSPTVEHFCLKAGPSEKQIYIQPIINYFLAGKKGKVIIFCETKRDVERITNSRMISIRRESLHGDVKQFIRERIFKNFKKSEIDCIVATNVAARGLDFPQIDLVIQMQPPRTTEEYIHRSGRTGRAGKKGVCATLCSFKEEATLQRIEKETKIILHWLNQKDIKSSSLEKQEPRSGNRSGRGRSSAKIDSYDNDY